MPETPIALAPMKASQISHAALVSHRRKNGNAQADLICTPEDVRATARHHNVEATILPGLAHLLMLEPGWEQVAKALEAWVRTLD